LGVTDKRPRQVVGSKAFPQPERTRAGLMEQLHLRVDFSIIHHKFFNNYFHFWNNVASKIGMLELLEIPDDIPVVIPSNMANIPFVRDALALRIFGKRPVFYQGAREILHVQMAYIVKPFDIDAKILDKTLDLMDLPREPKGERRIFISRGPASPNKRFFRNQADLDELLGEFDIEKIDPQELSLEAQMDVFSHASLIVSAHGAGLTNLLFRRYSSCRVIELFNPDLLSLHYALIANSFGHDYHALENLRPRGRSSVATSRVNIDQLRDLLTS